MKSPGAPIRRLPNPTPTRTAALLVAAVMGWAGPAAAADDPLARLQAEFARVVTPGEQADLHRQMLGSVLQRAHRSHSAEIDMETLTAAASKALAQLPAARGDPAVVFGKAVDAALRTLDPYSRYVDPRAHAQQRADASGRFVGLGIEVEAAEGVVRVVAPMPGGPAERAGLRAGDLILQVDGQPLEGTSLADAVTRMRGEAGTQVAIKVRRPGADAFDLSLTRDTIHRPLLKWRMEGDALVLRLSSFSGPVSAALSQGVAEALAAHAPRSVVLDLRGNPGGLLREAIQVADAFLPHGEIASMRGRTPSTQRTWTADAAELLPGLPLVVLIDRRSASASELVAAALQGNGRAAVLGQRSFGKGSVQSTFGLGEGHGAVKLTTALYYGPSGRAVNRSGVTPDVELLTAAPAPAAEGAPPAAHLRVTQARCAAEALPSVASDGALACALSYLRAGGTAAFAQAYGDAPH